jgi:hypothetical protein
MSTSWKPEVQTDSTGAWYGNALRFATEEEALANVKNLASRWFAVRDYRASPSDDPVNYAWINGALVSVETEAA